MKDPKYECDQCGFENGYPMMDVPDGRELCLRCIRAEPNLFGLEPFAVEVHEMMMDVAAPRPRGGWPGQGN